MDRAKNLREAEQHVLQSERHIAEQERRVADLDRTGHDTAHAWRLLGNLRDLQAKHIEHRNRLLQDLARQGRLSWRPPGLGPSK